MLVKAIEKGGVPVAHITAIPMLSKQLATNRVITAAKIPHPCGDPNLSPDADLAIRKEIVNTALKALQTEVSGPTIFTPNVKYTLG